MLPNIDGIDPGRRKEDRDKSAKLKYEYFPKNYMNGSNVKKAGNKYQSRNTKISDVLKMNYMQLMSAKMKS